MFAKLSDAWLDYFRRANEIYGKLRGLDRTLCILITIVLAERYDREDGVTPEDIVATAGSYTSFSTARRYLRTFVDRGLATTQDNNARKVIYKATPQLLCICQKHAELVRRLGRNLGES